MNYREAWANGEIEAGTLVDAIEEQAREIERLQLTCNDIDDQNDRIYAELAALKARPSGVVLPDPMRRGDEGGSGEYGGAMIRGYNACLREVARLNSSPVRAGWMMPTAKQLEQALESVPSFHDLSAELIAPAMLGHLRDVISAGEYGDAYRGARDDMAIWKRRALEAETKVREQDQIIENLGNALNDENGPTFMGEPVLKARAALSAPSHGDQVRHMVPAWMASARTFVDRLHLAGWRDHADAQHAGVAGMYDELLAAAPSAGSQGGDV